MIVMIVNVILKESETVSYSLFFGGKKNGKKKSKESDIMDINCNVCSGYFCEFSFILTCCNGCHSKKFSSAPHKL